jgi:vacuolar iron transporter family protein
MQNSFATRKNKILFGSTSAIITNTALIVGLNGSKNAQMNIIASILVIAVADNISDSLGIHIYQEAEGLSKKDLWISSLSNFTARFLVSMIFILFVMFLPLNLATVCSVIFGLLIITGISYDMAIYKKTDPFKAVASHVTITIIVILACNFLRNWLGGLIS